MLSGLKGTQSCPLPPPLAISPLNHIPSSSSLPHAPFSPHPHTLHSFRFSTFIQPLSVDPVPHLPGSPSLLTLPLSFTSPPLKLPVGFTLTFTLSIYLLPSMTDGLTQGPQTSELKNERGREKGDRGRRDDRRKGKLGNVSDRHGIIQVGGLAT